MSAKGIEKPEQPLDLKKLGQDFADLADQRKFPEILILAKQVKLSPRQLTKAFEQAINIMQKKSPLTLISKPFALGTAGGAVLGGALAGEIVYGAMAGGSTGAAVDLLQQSAQQEKLQKLVEAKEWLEDNS